MSRNDTHAGGTTMRAMRLAALPLLIALHGCDGCLENTVINEELGRLPFAQERVLKKANTYQHDLAALVGHALILTKDSVGLCGPATGGEFDAIYLWPESYLKPDAKLEPKTINEVIYDHKVSDSAAASLGVFDFSASLSGNRLAHVTITDAAFLNFPSGSLAPDWHARIQLQIQETECPAVLIRGAKVRVATYRFFDRRGSTVGLSQSVFKANGGVFHENAKTYNEVVVTITPNLITGSRSEPDTGVTVAPNDTTVLPRVLGRELRAVSGHQAVREMLRKWRMVPRAPRQ